MRKLLFYNDKVFFDSENNFWNNKKEPFKGIAYMLYYVKIMSGSFQRIHFRLLRIEIEVNLIGIFIW